MEELKPKVKKVVQFIITVVVIALIITTVCLLMLKYSVEGESNMPFKLEELVVVSTAEGMDIEGTENLWNFDIVQNNDIYLHIAKNKNYKETEIIKNIIINNIKIEEAPKKGNIVVYRPTQKEDIIYENKDEYKMENEIIFVGSEATNAKNLEISNQGGRIMLRFCNNEIGKYTSNDEIISHDGTMLSKIDTTYEEIKCKISFDITIELVSGTKFTGNLKIDLPVGDIVNAGKCMQETKDFKNVIFKRN